MINSFKIKKFMILIKNYMKINFFNSLQYKKNKKMKTQNKNNLMSNKI